MVRTSILTFFAAVTLTSAATLDLYYTEDGHKIEFVRGYGINKDLTISEEGNESWLIAAGYQIGPNGYMDKQSKLSVGTIGKKTASFIPGEEFLGIGVNRRFERAIALSDIAYILPNPKPLEPLVVRLNDDTQWELFVSGDYTECSGEKRIGNRVQNNIFLVKLKYDVPKGQRTYNTRPQQLGIKARAVAFSEQGLRKALRTMKF